MVRRISVVSVEGFVIIGIVRGIRKGFLFIVNLLGLFDDGKIILSVIRNRIIFLVIFIVFCFMFRKLRIDWLLNKKRNRMLRVNNNFWIRMIWWCFGFIDLSIDMNIGRLFKGFMIKKSMMVVD